MSWFSKNVISPVKDFFKGPDLSGITAAINQQASAVTSAAQSQSDAASKALDLQKDAMKNAAASAVPLQDSESARQAAEARMRRLLATTAPFTPGLDQLGSAPVGYRMLTGR